MNIDKKIKQELENEAQQLDHMFAHDPSLFKMLANTFKGALGRWVVLISVITFFITLLMFWCGYQFFFVEGVSGGELMHKLHWGVGLVITAMMVTIMKIWVFMEMNRQSILREIKRVELAVAQLKQ